MRIFLFVISIFFCMLFLIPGVVSAQTGTTCSLADKRQGAENAITRKCSQFTQFTTCQRLISSTCLTQEKVCTGDDFAKCVNDTINSHVFSDQQIGFGIKLDAETCNNFVFLSADVCPNGTTGFTNCQGKLSLDSCIPDSSKCTPKIEEACVSKQRLDEIQSSCKITPDTGINQFKLQILDVPDGVYQFSLAGESDEGADINIKDFIPRLTLTGKEIRNIDQTLDLTNKPDGIYEITVYRLFSDSSLARIPISGISNYNKQVCYQSFQVKKIDNPVPEQTPNLTPTLIPTIIPSVAPIATVEPTQTNQQEEQPLIEQSNPEEPGQPEEEFNPQSQPGEEPQNPVEEFYNDIQDEIPFLPELEEEVPAIEIVDYGLLLADYADEIYLPADIELSDNYVQAILVTHYSDGSETWEQISFIVEEPLYEESPPYTEDPYFVPEESVQEEQSYFEEEVPVDEYIEPPQKICPDNCQLEADDVCWEGPYPWEEDDSCRDGFDSYEDGCWRSCE